MATDHSFFTRITTKLHYAYRNWRCRSLTSEPAWQRVNHFEMKLGSQDLMDRAFFVGDYDPALLCAMDKLVAKGDHCIDIGAHKGYVTLSLSSLVGETGKVFCFEPDAEVRSRLLENVEHNQRSNIQVFPYALGSEEGQATFFLSEQSGWSSRFPNEMAQARIKSEVHVPIRVVDQLVSSAEMGVDATRLSFVKVDCEGSEPGVLAGMKDLLARATPVLWIEVNRDSLRAAHSSIAALQTILLELGLRIYSFDYQESLWGKPSIRFQPIEQIPTDQEFAFDIVATKRALA